jgi:hypothetical protein
VEICIRLSLLRGNKDGGPKHAHEAVQLFVEKHLQHPKMPWQTTIDPNKWRQVRPPLP